MKDNHYPNRNNYHDISSFKIRQPSNETPHLEKHNPVNYTTTVNFHNYYHKSSSGFGHKNAKPFQTPYASRQHSRDISYNSKGSSLSKSSMKISDYVVLEAKNLLKNKQKYKYESQNHMRSTSMYCHSKNQRAERYITEQNSQKYNNHKNQHPIQIPSFGIECRMLASGAYPYEGNSSLSAKKQNLSIWKTDEPSISYKLQNRHIKTEIDERIQRLRTSSTSTRHKERLSNIKTLDANRLQNMDKINVKIKNILSTLEQEQDHYKKRFGDKSELRHLKTEGSLYGQNSRLHELVYREEQKCLGKFKKQKSQQSRFSYVPNYKIKEDNIRSGKYTEKQQFFGQNSLTVSQQNISSYYYYEDESAILKSSQSPFKSSPSRSFKKKSLDKDQEKSCQSFSQLADPSIQKHYMKFNPKAQSNPPIRSPLKSQLQSQSTPFHLQKYNKVQNNTPNYETEMMKTRSNLNQSSLLSHGKLDLQKCYSFKTDQSAFIEKKALTPFSQTENQTNQDYERQHYFRTSALFIQETHPLQNRSNKVYQKKTNAVYCKTEEKQRNSNNKLNDERFQENRGDRENQFQFQFLQNPSKINSRDKSPYLQTFDFRQNNFFQKENKTTFQQNFNPREGHHYSDSIKETPRIWQSNFKQKKNIQIKQTFSPLDTNVRSNSKKNLDTNVGNNQNKNLDDKIKQYEKRLSQYNRQISASKLLQSPKSQQEKSQRYKQSRRLTHQQILCKIENNLQTPFSQIRHQTKTEQITSNQFNKLVESNIISRKYQNFAEGQIYNQLKTRNPSHQVETPKKYSPRENQHFAKDDHKKLIQNLRRQRQEAAALSKSRHKGNKSSSIDISRLKGFDQRSQSQNSRLSSQTIVKGKNVDQEIQKIEKKMQEYKKMKKQLQLQSQPNTQRSNKNKFQAQVEVQTSNNEVPLKNWQQKSPLNSKVVKLESLSPPYSSVRKFSQRNIESFQNRPNSLITIFPEENTYVKVRKSILKEHKTNQIKNYLDEELQKQSNCNQSTSRKNQNLINAQFKHKVIKQNLAPQTTAAINSPMHSKASKKVVFGLAQNLVNCLQQNNDDLNGSTHDVRTPKLLKNFKNKTNDKSIIKKKVEKKGFRSQFINDLHEDNNIVCSSRKEEIVQDDWSQDSAIRFLPQNKQNLYKILSLLQHQILIDEKFRNGKKMLNAMITKDKWSDLLKEYKKSVSNEKNVQLQDLMEIFSLTEEENNPFYSTRGVEFTLQSLVGCYIESQKNWASLGQQVSLLSIERIKECGINQKNLDIERKGYIDVDDLTRFLNMQLNKYYRRRDLCLIWRRLSIRSNKKPDQHREQQGYYAKLSYEQLLWGLGSVIRHI